MYCPLSFFDIWLSCKRLARYKCSRLYGLFVSYEEKSFITMGPGADLIKPFWQKFTCSCCKLDLLITMQQILHMLVKMPLYQVSFIRLTPCITVVKLFSSMMKRTYTLSFVPGKTFHLVRYTIHRNVKLGWKDLLGTNISVLGIFISDEEKSFTTLWLAINVMKNYL